MNITTLRELCAVHWNPIGIVMALEGSEETLGYPPLPDDEYDLYLAHVLDLLDSAATDQEIVEYLELVEREALMLEGPHGDKHSFVAAVRAAQAGAA